MNYIKEITQHLSNNSMTIEQAIKMHSDEWILAEAILGHDNPVELELMWDAISVVKAGTLEQFDSKLSVAKNIERAYDYDGGNIPIDATKSIINHLYESVDRCSNSASKYLFDDGSVLVFIQYPDDVEIYAA